MIVITGAIAELERTLIIERVRAARRVPVKKLADKGQGPLATSSTARKGTFGAVQRGLASLPSARTMGDRDLVDAATCGEDGVVRKLDAVGNAGGVVHHHRIADLLGL